MNFRSVVMGLTALGVLASFSACKPIRSEQGAKSAQSVQPVQATQPVEESRKRSDEPSLADLKVGFCLSSTQSTVPDFDRPTSDNFLEGAVTDGQILQLKKRVGTARASTQEGPIFLVFSDAFGAKRVVDASYEHRTVSVSNLAQESSRRALVSYDRDTHHYFISLDEILNRSGDGISSLDLQVLNLNLNWSDGSVSHFELRFYAKGDLPSMDKVRLSQVFNEPKYSQGKSGQKLTSVMAATHGGWVVLTERYKNPISRPLTLWYSAKDVSFQVLTQLGMRVPGRFNEFSLTDEAGFQIGPHQFSLATLNRTKIVVRDPSSGSSQSFPLSSDSRLPIRINPGQELEIEWRVLVSDDVPLCQDGGPVTWNFRACFNFDPAVPVKFWAAEVSGCQNPGGILEPVYHQPAPISGTWEIQSYQVTGQFKNDVILTEDIGTQEQSLIEAEKERIALNIPVSASKSGSSLATAPMLPQYSCQGIF